MNRRQESPFHNGGCVGGLPKVGRFSLGRIRLCAEDILEMRAGPSTTLREAVCSSFMLAVFDHESALAIGCGWSWF